MSVRSAGGPGGELRRELRKILVKTVVLRGAAGSLAFVALAGWVFLVAVAWIAFAGDLSVAGALGLSRSTLVVVLAAFVALVVVPVARVPTLRKIAFELERRKDFQDLVAAGYEFSESDAAMKRYSPELVREVIRQAVRSVAGLQVRFLFVERRLLALVPVAYSSLALLVIIAAVSPAIILETARTIVAPSEAARFSHEANLFCTPGDATVIAGSDVEVIARDFGGSREPVTLSFTLSNGFWKTEPTTEREPSAESGAALGVHAYTFKDVRGDIEYFFGRGSNRTRTFTIRVVHKPVVTDLALVLTPPAYTGEPPDTLVDSGGNISALEGTEVRIDGRSNNVLTGAWGEFEGGEKKTARVDGRRFDLGFRAVRDGTYSIVLRDSLGHETEDPVAYSIDVFEDRPPVLDVIEPGDDALLPRNLIVGLGFTTADDYGVREAAVYHRKGGEDGFEKTHIPLGEQAGERELLVSHEWNLEGLTLFPGEFVEYYVEVKDNNVVTGPGVTRSKIFHIAVPTMAELYERSEAESEYRTDVVEEAIKEGVDLKERVEKLAREMKKSGQMDWSRQKEIDSAIASQEKIQDMLEEMQNSLDESLESLSENKMTSQEIGEKLEEINRLIKEINSEALNKYIEQMREAMEKLDPEQLRAAMENLNMSTEDLLKNLERTEALLKEIQREQQMEEAVRKTKDLMEAQEKVSDRTADADDRESMETISPEQEKLAEQAGELEKDLDELANKIDDKELAEQLKKSSEQSSMSRTAEEMRKASRQLQEGQKNQAMSHQKQAMENLVGLFKNLASMQMQMQSASNNRLAANLQRLANSTLQISFKQEELTGRIRERISAEGASGATEERSLAEEQQMYARAVEQIADELYEMAKQSALIPGSLIRGLGQCREGMQSSLLFLEQNKAFMSATSASQATTMLNRVTIDLLRACSNCSGGGSGNPQSSPLLQRLLSGQQQVLRETEQLLALRAAQEKLMQEMQADVERLAGEQRSLREMAEQIQGDLKQNERVLGRMDRTIEEMNEVIKDLEGGSIGEQTLRKQERILSRLLDAQRSIHSRDYEKQRVSKTAEDIFSKGGDLSRAQPGSQALREEIRRAMELKAPGEFEELIRLYFRALADEAQAAPGTP